MLPFSRRALLPGCIIGFIFYSLYWAHREQRFSIADVVRPAAGNGHSSNSHPIDHLRAQAESDFYDLLRKVTNDDASAVQAYESRRGRRPPPGFDKWLQFARDKNAVMVEDFFDRIYDDLAPFWATFPKLLREQAHKHHLRIDVRAGAAKIITHYDQPWMNLWGDLIGTISEYLPDLSLPINDMDESRVIAPYNVIAASMSEEAKLHRIVPEADVITQYSTSGETNGIAPGKGTEDLWIHKGRYWDLVAAACSPESPARSKYSPESDFQKPLPLTGNFPDHSYQGYVANWTLTKSPCDKPQLQQIHGALVQPISLSTTSHLIPIFGGSKLPVNNDILLPPAMYWSRDERFMIGDNNGGEWDYKHNQIIWRGASTGGENQEENWMRFHRHRFVSMMNATTVAFAESNLEGRVPNFVLPQRKAYDLHANSLAGWIGDSADAAFGDMLCFPDGVIRADGNCPYHADWFSPGHKMPLADQLSYKYLPDIDGNSFSGRYRAFLTSTSLPIKATVYDEWHDSRLVPWKHFVPMDNTFTDLYGIMEYFMGSKGHHGPGEGVAGHDDAARDIALSGKNWAEKVLRREDMQIYVFRLLLEWARLLDDNRERLGYIHKHQ